jgi:hypothetical protein
MAEKQEVDQSRLIDQALLLFENAMAETETVLPRAQFGCAVTPKDVPPSEVQEKRAASLIGRAVSFVRTVTGYEPQAVQPSTLLQPPVAKQGPKKPVRDERSDPLVDQAPLVKAIVPVDELSVAETASRAANTTETAAPSLRQPVDKPASKDVRRLERPTQKDPPSPVDDALSLTVKKVAISKPRAVQTAPPPLQQPVDKPASKVVSLERPTQKDPPSPIDDALSLVKDVVISERKTVLVKEVAISAPRVVQTVSPSLQLPVDKPASKVVPLERPTQKDPPSPIDDTLSLVKDVVISERKTVLVKEVAISAPRAVQTVSPSLQLPVDKPASKVVPLERPTQKDPPSPIDDTLFLVKDVVISERKTVLVKEVAISEPRVVQTASPSLQRPVDKPASKDVPPFELPTQKDPPSPIDDAPSLVKDVVISAHKAALITKVAIPEPKGVQAVSPSFHRPVDKPAAERPARDARPAALVDQVPPMVAILPIDEPNVVVAASPVLSLRQPVDKLVSKDLVLPLLQCLIREEPSSLIDEAHSAVVAAAPTKAVAPLPQQPLMQQHSPNERLDMDLADIRRRVAIFNDHQKRFQREREEREAIIKARARGLALATSDRDSGHLNLPPSRDGN